MSAEEREPSGEEWRQMEGWEYALKKLKCKQSLLQRQNPSK